MTEPINELGLYLHLARAGGLRQQPMTRDRLLVLCSAIASEMGLTSVAAYCRQKILESNPMHMLRQWPTVAEAMEHESFLSIVRSVIRRYPPEKAELMIESLGIQMHNERATYYSDEEYAASLLGVSLDELQQAEREVG